MTEKEKRPQEIIEEKIKELDIRLDEEDRIAFWFPEIDYRKIQQEVARRENQGEYWRGGLGFSEILGKYKGHKAVVCQRYSYGRFADLIEEVGVNFHVGRVLNKQRLPLDHQRRRGRGTLIPEIPPTLRVLEK